MVGKANSEKSFPQTAAIAAAVGGLVVGLMANAGRKALVQGMSAAAGEWDDSLKAEHDATRMIFDALEQTSDDQTIKRNALLVQLKHALTKHAHEEENVVYPAMRENGLTEQADDLNREHGYTKQFLYELTKMPADDPEWIAKVGEFRTELERHMMEEENNLFPSLRLKLGMEGNNAVTAAMHKEGFKVA